MFYRQRPDVRAVIHPHLVFANALVISLGSIRMDVIPEAAGCICSIPVTSYSLPPLRRMAEAIRGLIGSHNVLLIRNHGSLAVGRDWTRR
jgi:L-fuculose-phosphate aldolase